MYGRLAETGKQGVAAAFALVIIRNSQMPDETKERIEFQDIKEFWDRRNAEMGSRGFDDEIQEITVVRMDDGNLDEFNAVELDYSIKIGDPYIQVLCRYNNSLSRRIEIACNGYAWWPENDRLVGRHYTCDHCLDDEEHID